VSTTPNVDKVKPDERMGLMSENRVSIPPANKITHRAIIPTNWACLTLLKTMPTPSTPKSIPANKNKSKAGIPNLPPALVIRILLKMRIDPIRRMLPEVRNVMIFRVNRQTD
jgi:hypothetical protein